MKPRALVVGGKGLLFAVVLQGLVACDEPAAQASSSRSADAAPSIVATGPSADADSPSPDPSADPRPAVAAPAIEPRDDAAKGPRIFLIVIDTLRRDRVAPFSPYKDATPFIAALAKDGVVFTSAYSTSSWTVPAMYSMMTGLYPREHGVTGGSVGGGGVVGQPSLPKAATTLAEHLHSAGYTTFGVCTNHHLHERFGFAQGFDRFVGNGFLKLPFPQLAVDSMRADIAAASRPFVWIHFFDPHAPYGTNEPWFSRRNGSGFANWGAFSLDAVGRVFRKQHGLAPEDPIPLAEITAMHRRARVLSLANPGEIMKVARLGGEALERRYLGFLEAAYDSEVAKVDDALGQIFAALEIGEEDLVVIAADHGEALMEHGGIGHRWLRSLHEELVHVPLIIRLPRGRAAGTVVDAPVSLVDLLPTILEAARIDARGYDGFGRSLLPLIGGAKEARVLYGELTEPAADVRFRLELPWKYIHDFSLDRGRLYDLSRDPSETRDLASSRPALAEEMRAGLFEWMAKTGPRWRETEVVPLSSQELEQLRAMGYLM